MQIREATIDDLEVLKGLIIEFENEYLQNEIDGNNPYTSFNEQAEEIIRNSIDDDFNSGKKFLVAEENKEIIGHARVTKRQSARGIYNVTEFGSITYFRVKKEYRKKGVGTALFNEAIKLLKQMGAEFVSVSTSPKNKDAISFYKESGFHEYEIEFLKKI